MLAVRIHEDGGPDVLRVEDVPAPIAGPGEVLVRLRAASLNHLDVWTRMGMPSVPKPRILGADGAGVVEALGPGVETPSLAPGAAVVLNPGLEDGRHVLGEHRDGTHAELIAVPADYVHPLPPGLSFEEAAALPLVFVTAYRLLVTRCRLAPGEWVLVWGIGSGVGTAALALARALGAHVVCTSGSPAKLARARELGADVVVDHARDDVVAACRAATEGRGVDVVVEHVGAATWDRTLSACARGARIGVVGATSGQDPPARLARLWWKELSVLGSTMGTREDFRAMLDVVASGRARPVVDSVLPLARVADAHRRLEAGEQLGKIVLAIPG